MQKKTKDDDDDPLSVRTTKHSKTPVHNNFHCSLMLRLALLLLTCSLKGTIVKGFLCLLSYFNSQLSAATIFRDVQ